jgi:hypothetical protein
VSSLECEVCQLGNIIESSFLSSSHSRQSESFDVVHTDTIWGPSCISTLNRFLYFVILLDDMVVFNEREI